jgi:hypothetical protein
MLQPKELLGTSRRVTGLTPKLEKHLMAYFAMASATVAVATPAMAEIVYTPTRVEFDEAGSGLPAYYHIDLNNDGIVDFALASFVGATTRLQARSLEVYPCYCSNPNGVVGTFNSKQNFAAVLPAGVEIGPARHFIADTVAMPMAEEHIHKNGSSVVLSTTFQGKWANGGKGIHSHYLGLKFLIDGEVHYGWARITISKASLMTGYAYETVANKPIIAGATSADADGQQSKSEVPASLGYLAEGANGLSVWRREVRVPAH